MYKLIIVSWLFLLLATSLQAQTKWFNPLEDEHAHYIQNQAWDEDGGNYNRLPARASQRKGQRCRMEPVKRVGRIIHTFFD